MIELKNVVVKAKNRLILDVPELHFEKGKRYGIIGENGSGKTTLLRLLMGTVKASQGSIEGLKPGSQGRLSTAIPVCLFFLGSQEREYDT